MQRLRARSAGDQSAGRRGHLMNPQRGEASLNLDRLDFNRGDTMALLEVIICPAGGFK